MKDYARIIGEFQAALLENRPAAGETLATAQKDFAGSAQMQAYIAAYHIRLQKAVLKDYPALTHFLGAEELARLTAGYVEATPSRGYNLNPYAIGFADYIKSHTTDGFAHALAALESAILWVYLAEDSPAFSQAMLAGFTPSAPLHFRTAFTLLALPWDAESYLQSFRQGRNSQPVKRPIYLAICRHQNQTRRHPLEREEYNFLFQLETGLSLTEAIDAHQPQDEAAFTQQLQSWLGRWIKAGFFQPPVE